MVLPYKQRTEQKKVRFSDEPGAGKLPKQQGEKVKNTRPGWYHLQRKLGDNNKYLIY